ncbi:MAG: tRNA (adenosine(37)-N6)-threonylcarbamoyltransferase complex transferase subunit TsaD [Patescibacteria group bacterium]|jgi:N6-L-threonylcarbamoyladenine synthase
MNILGIETSCDETAASVVYGMGDKVKILSNVVSSQIEIHKKYGGVVPEVAAREHVLNILPVVNEALKGIKKIDAIVVTTGPGLITSLIVGVETAKTLAYAWGVPVVAINHIEGHIYANFINSKPKFPALILTVSGGHTMLILMTGHGKYKLLGETRDDAAGEAFDKAAQLLNLGYPGGPAVAASASKLKIEIEKLPVSPSASRGGKVKLPRPMFNSGDFDFSFSGLKTALLYEIQKDPLRRSEGEASKNYKKKIPEYAYEFQKAVAEVLVHKTIKAALKYNCKNIMLSGGVAANVELRNQLKEAVKNKLNGAKLIIPEFKYCTDNAAMIATAGYFSAKRKRFTPWQKLKADSNQELTN